MDLTRPTHRTLAWLTSALATMALMVFAAASAHATTIHEYPHVSPDSGLQDIIVGPDKAIWFTELYRDRLGRLDPSSGAVAEYSDGVPDGSAWPLGGGPYGLLAADDGSIWFSLYNFGRYAQFDIATKTVTQAATAQPAQTGPKTIIAGADGDLWSADQSGIGHLSSGLVAATYDAGGAPAVYPYSVVMGSDGGVWFTDYTHDKLGRIDVLTHQMVEYAAGITPDSYPLDLVSGPDGALWFTQLFTDQIGRLDPYTGAVTEYSAGITPGRGPFGITVGHDGNIWFTENSGGIGRIEPDSGRITEYHNDITPDSGVQEIVSDPSGHLWFTELSGNRIGRIDYTPPTASTESASGVGLTDAILHGALDSDRAKATWWFEYQTDADPTTWIPTASHDIPAGSASLPVSATLSGLSPHTQYHYRTAVRSVGGTAYGDVQDLRTATEQPHVTTGPADAIEAQEATLRGTVDQRGAVTRWWFEYRRAQGAEPWVPTSPADMQAEATEQHVAAQIKTLEPNQTYAYRILADNAGGQVMGEIREFTTAKTPTAPNAGSSLPATVPATQPAAEPAPRPTPESTGPPRPHRHPGRPSRPPSSSPVSPSAALAVSCAGKAVALIDVTDRGDQVAILGAAAPRYVGHRVAVIFAATGQTVALARVRSSGFFHATAALPQAALRYSNRTRYRALIAGKHSLSLKLHRRMTIETITRHKHRIELSGHIAGMMTDHLIQVREQTSCSHRRVVGTARPSPSGHWKITVPKPRSGRAVLYTATTQVRSQNGRVFPTFTLPGYLTL